MFLKSWMDVGFVKCFFSLFIETVMQFSFGTLFYQYCYYIYWFSDYKTTVYSLDKFSLVLVYNHFLYGAQFGLLLLLFMCQCSWGILILKGIVLWFLCLVLYLGTTSHMEWDRKCSFLCFQKEFVKECFIIVILNIWKNSHVIRIFPEPGFIKFHAPSHWALSCKFHYILSPFIVWFLLAFQVSS